MPNLANREQVQEMIGAGAQVVEVLPPEEYSEGHLPKAVNIPLKEFYEEAIAELDPRRPVIVYCADLQ